MLRTPKESITGKPISSILVDDKEAFQRAVEVMKNDDSRSYKLRFTVAMGSMSTLSKGQLSPEETPEDSKDAAESLNGESTEAIEDTALTLEGQGILIFDRATGNPSHVRSAQHLLKHRILTVITDYVGY